jgi:hypothetical protein
LSVVNFSPAVCDNAQTHRRGHKTLLSCTHWSTKMNLSLTPLVSLVAGILILIVPRLLNYIVAVYLIVIGILGLMGDVHLR